MNKLTLKREISVKIARGLDVPNFFNDVPNFLIDVLNLLKDIPRVSKSIPTWERLAITSQGSLNDQMDHEKGHRGPSSPMIGCTKFS